MKAALAITGIYFFICYQSFCQTNKSTIDSNLFISQKYIFRATLTSPASQDDHAKYSGIFSLNAERIFAYNLTLSTKIGVASSTKDFGTPQGKYQTSYHVFANAELRYFYAQGKRQKHNRTTLNKSGGYFALEEKFISSPFALINQTESNALQKEGSLFFNIGYQKQYMHFYLQIFGGVLLIDGLPKPFGSTRTPINLGASIGYVF